VPMAAVSGRSNQAVGSVVIPIVAEMIQGSHPSQSSRMGAFGSGNRSAISVRW
jgi:hypothetical protein